MEKDALSVSGIDSGCDASLGSAGPVVPADEAWVVGWLVPPTWAALQLSNQLIFLLSLPPQTQTHTHTHVHTHIHKRTHTQILENTNTNMNSQMYPNSNFVISNSYSDVNLKSSLFSMNVILPDNSFIRGSLEFACPLAL